MKKLNELFDEPIAVYGNYGISEILDYFIKKTNNIAFFIYGDKERACFICEWYTRTYKIRPAFIAVPDTEINTPCLWGNRDDIICESSIKEQLSKDERKYFAVVACDNYAEKKDSLKLLLKSYGAAYVCGEGKIFKPFKVGWYAEYFRQNISQFEVLYNDLADELSRETMYEYLKVFVCGQRFAGVTFSEKNKYWGIDDGNGSMFALPSDVTLLNVGAAGGDTLFNFMKTHEKFKKIIAVDGSSGFSTLKTMLELLDESLRKKIELNNIFLDAGANSIDTLYSDERIDIINMDIEGAELSVLSTAVKTLRRCRPVLSVCAYHKRDDLITIPAFVRKNLTDYIFALRKYPSNLWDWVDGYNQCNELVLYAIPKEKYTR